MNVSRADDDEIDLQIVWNTIWNDKILIGVFTAIFSVVAILYALSLPNYYRSETLLAPAENTQPANPLLSQLGVAAGLLGVSTTPSATRSSQINTAIALVQSRSFILRFIQRHGMIADLLQEDLFDSNSEEIETSRENAAYLTFRNALSVAENRENGLYTIAIEWINSQKAYDWLSWLIIDLNSEIKQQDIEEATNAINYLQDQLTQTQLVEMQRVFYDLIKSQMQVLMLADVRDSYVFRIIDPAYIPNQKSSPQRSRIAIFGFSMGLVFGVFFVLVRSRFRTI